VPTVLVGDLEISNVTPRKAIALMHDLTCRLTKSTALKIGVHSFLAFSSEQRNYTKSKIGKTICVLRHSSSDQSAE
jgi:hypothetical protein